MDDRRGRRAGLTGLMALALLAGPTAASPSAPVAAVEFGVDRSNMATEWTLTPPHEPNVSPFLAADYNKPGNFEARRVAVLDGVAKVHAQWFRDDLGKGPPELFTDLVTLVHARGMKMLAIAGPDASDFPPGAGLTKQQSGCAFGTLPLSKINLAAYQKRIEARLSAVRAAGQTIDAFEIGNELDLYCNDADNPTPADWAKHGWKWFLSPAQVQTFVGGYGPFLAASVASIRKSFPDAKIITYGNSMPASAPLIEALARARGPNGQVTDYTKLVDGYGVHLYPVSDTTQGMVQWATGALRDEAPHYPHLEEKSIWITEWNPSASSWWNGRPWYFQYDAHGQPGGELNKADAQGAYKAMDRAGAIRAFNRDVVGKLRTSTPKPINISHVFFYDYDSGGKSPKCDHVKYAWNSKLVGWCADGLIDPSTGALLSDVAAAVTGS
jgi:hypothetical protein